MVAGGLRAVPVHVLPAGGPVLPCVLAGMLLGGADVPVFPWVCPECLGFGTGQRGPVGRLGSGKVSLRLRSWRSLMGPVERVRYDESLLEAYGCRLPDGIPAWEVWGRGPLTVAAFSAGASP